MMRDATPTQLTLTLAGLLLVAPAPAWARPATPPQPDRHGYAMFDQGDAQCGFDFVDIRATGTPVSFTASGADPAEDDGAAVVTLSVPFELYGEPLTSLVMSSNGYLARAATLAAEDGGDYSNDGVLPAIPDNASGVPGRVFVYHDDLDGASGTAYEEHFAVCPRPSESLGLEPCTILQWTDWLPPGLGDAFDAQVVLYHDSFEIVLQHSPGLDALVGGTIGLQNDTATVGLQYRPAAVDAATAVCILEPRYPPGGRLADLEITKHAGSDDPLPAGSVGYSIGVLNRGPSPVVGATVEDVVPTTLSGCVWTCLASDDGSTCTASGSGDLLDVVDLEPGGWADYVLVCAVAPSSGLVANTASVATPPEVADPDLANNTATADVASAAGRLTDTLRVDLRATVLELTWGASCAATDVDFAVYEGTLGDFTSHVPVVCSTAGVATLTHPSPPGSTYYLAVPHNLLFDGSFGLTDSPTERPPGPAPCRPQSIETCE